MCFSPEASFAGGIIISSIGIATIKKVHKPSQYIFASIPLFFGFQQIVEGILWLTIPNTDYSAIQNIGTYIYLIMADVLWPLMIPLSVLFMEENIKRKRILWIPLGMGISLSMYYAYCILFFKFRPQIECYHIQYNTNFPEFLSYIAFPVYLIAITTPLFISSIKRTKLLGALMLIACLITLLFFRYYLASVWCFFAASISVVIFWILKGSKKQVMDKN